MSQILKPDAEDKGLISKPFLKKLLRSDFKNYYSTPHLNDILYLHYKGFEKITNLEEFTGLKVLYLEGNGLTEISGLTNQVNMRTLYLHENLIKKIEGLETMTQLRNLNLSDNLIDRVEGLATLEHLSTLQIKRNNLGSRGIEDLVGLLECPSISTLDISDNRIAAPEVINEILIKMPNLTVLYMQNNPVCKEIPSYRKTLITSLPKLKYLDDRPVFDDERRFAEAWKRGGLEEERKERILYKKQQQQQHWRRHNQFREMMERFKREKEQEDRNKKDSESESGDSSRKEEHLESYNTPSASNSEHFPSEQSDHSIEHTNPEDTKSVRSEKSYSSQVEILQAELGKTHLNEDEVPALEDAEPKKDLYLEQLD